MKVESVYQPEEKRLRDYVAEALARNEDNPAKAERALVALAGTDGSLASLLIEFGAAQVIRDFFHRMRSSAHTIAETRLMTVVHYPEDRRLQGGDLSERTAARIARIEFWDRYTLFGQTRLRLATRPALAESVKNRRAQARGNLLRARFESAVSRNLVDDETSVGHALTLSEVEELAGKFSIGGSDAKV